MSKIIAVCALLMSTLALPTSFTSSRAQNRSAEEPGETITLFGGSGSDLLKRCSAPTPKVGDTMPANELVRTARDHGLCAGYIIGVSDVALNYLLQAQKGKRGYCPPSGVHSDQLIVVVKKYLEDNPAELHLPAGVLTTNALTDAFPCR